MRLKDKVAVVTAGASGIGRATAELFAKEGARVVRVDIDEDNVRSVTEGIRGSGGEATFVRADVSVADQVKSLISRVVQEFGRIDVLFNGVGINMGKPVPDCTEDDFDAVMTTNVKSTFLGCKYVIPHMLDNGGGVIVNNSSNAGLVGRPADALYVASKHAVNGLTKSLALAYADKGIRVNSVCPGPIATPLLFENLGDGEDREAYLKKVVANCPTPRAAAPEEVASAALFLACDESSFVNGVTLPVDGAKAAGVFNADRYSLDFDLQM